VDASPNIRDTYTKIQTILGCAYSERRHILSIEHLVEAVESARSPSFTYFRAHRRKGSELVSCSKDLIRERVKLCADLGLIEPASGELSKLGLDALKPETFNRILAKQAQNYLAQRGFMLDASGVRRRTSASDLWLPTARALYDDAHPAMALPEFRRMLNLLVRSGRVRALQSRLYFPQADR
jgi:hypothetical protein